MNNMKKINSKIDKFKKMQLSTLYSVKNRILIKLSINSNIMRIEIFHLTKKYLNTGVFQLPQIN